MYAIPAAVVVGNASQCLAALRQAIDGGETEISVAALTHSDSSALAVLLAAVRHGQVGGRTVRLSGMPPALASLAKLYGVDGLLAVVATRAPA